MRCGLKAPPRTYSKPACFTAFAPARTARSSRPCRGRRRPERTGSIMPLAVLTSVLRSVKRPSLPGKLPALDLEVPDAVQYQLEDVAHGGVVDGTRVHLHDLAQDLLLTLRVVDRAPASDFSAMISCTMRARSFRARMSSGRPRRPRSKLPHPPLQRRLFHRTCDSICTQHIRQTSGFELVSRSSAKEPHPIAPTPVERPIKENSL